MYCLELMKSDVSNTSYCVEVDTGGLFHDVVRSWKMILESHGKVERFFWGKRVGTLNEIVSISAALCAKLYVAGIQGAAK